MPTAAHVLSKQWLLMCCQAQLLMCCQSNSLQVEMAEDDVYELVDQY